MWTLLKHENNNRANSLFYFTWDPDGRLNHVGAVYRLKRGCWDDEAISPTLPGYSAVQDKQNS